MSAGNRICPDKRALIASRREQTRIKLLKVALEVLALHGTDVKVFELIIKESRVSRTTFYKYFRTNEELIRELGREVSNELVCVVDPIVSQKNDPAARIACGVTIVLRIAMAYPQFAQLIVRGGYALLRADSLVADAVFRDIQMGNGIGIFTVSNKKLAFDLIFGPVIMACHSILTTHVSNSYPKELACAVLRSLGVTSDLAKRYAYLPDDDFNMRADSLLTTSPSIRGSA